MPRRFVTATIALCALASATLGTAVPAAPLAGRSITAIPPRSQSMKGEAACWLYDGERNYKLIKSAVGEGRTRPGAYATTCIFRGLGPGIRTVALEK